MYKCTLCSLPPNTEIVMNFISCNCHRKEQKYGVFIIVYAALLSICLTERKLLLSLVIYGNCNFHSQFYKSDDWESFLKISSDSLFPSSPISFCCRAPEDTLCHNITSSSVYLRCDASEHRKH